MARNIIQALEGIAFPTDRSRLVDYARRNNLTSRSLSALQAMPQRNYASMADVLAALPSKSQMRKHIAQETQEEMPEQEPHDERPEQEPALESAPRQAMEQWPAFPTLPPDPFGWQRIAAEWTRSYLEFWQNFWTGRNR